MTDSQLSQSSHGVKEQPPDTEPSSASPGFVAGCVAWAMLILAGAPLVAGMILVDRNLYVWVFLVCLCAIFLGYGGIVSALMERRTKPGRLVILLSVSALVVALMITVLPGRLSLRGSPVLFYLMGTALPGPIAAPFVAFRMRRRGRARLARVWPLVALWVAPAILLTIFTAVSVAVGTATHNRIAHVLAMPPLGLAGPWATQAARLVDFPNAGEFFSLPLALGLTAAMAGLIGLYVRRTQWRAAIIIPYATLASVWALIGFGQLLNCTS